MKALVKFGRQDGDVEIQEITEPTIDPQQVLLEVKAAGVCGSDLHMWREQHSWEIKLPLVLGHEFCGVVTRIGDQVTGFQPGDQVVCETAAQVTVHSPGQSD